MNEPLKEFNDFMNDFEESVWCWVRVLVAAICIIGFFMLLS